MSNRSMAIALLGFAGLLILGIASQINMALHLPAERAADTGYVIGYSLPSVLLGALVLWVLYKAYTLWNKE